MAALALARTERTYGRYRKSQVRANEWDCCYTVCMHVRVALALVLVATPVLADTFGGFSGVDRPYLINQDRVCQPLAVAGGAATGAPKCEKAGADVIANLSVKPPVEQSGANASFSATAQGKQLTVARKDGSTVVTWNAPDPIGKVVAVYASQYEDRVAVAYTVRRLGKEVTDVVAFELVKTTGSSGTTTSANPSPSPSPSPSPTADDPKVTAAVDAAHKQSSLAAWKKVTALEPAHAEALYKIAQLELAAKHRPEALAALDELAKSPRPDAIEWQVEARFDKAFAPLRAEARFRQDVGLDRKAQSPYERAMGFGGQWEQTGTSCDKPEVRLDMMRDRSFKLRVKTVCEGQVFDQPFKGQWRIDGDQIVLTLPTKGQKASAKDDAPCKFERSGDEDALRCSLGRDLEFVVLPTRR